MTENIQVANGDFVTLAKVVNGNTVSLDNELKAVVKACSETFKLVDDNIGTLDKRVTAHNKALKHAGKALKWFGFSLMIGNLTMFMLDRKVKNLEEKVKKLEDKQVVDDFMKDEDLDCLK